MWCSMLQALFWVSLFLVIGVSSASDSCSSAISCETCAVQDECVWDTVLGSCCNFTVGCNGGEIVDADSCPTEGCSVDLNCESCVNNPSFDCGWSPSASHCCNVTAGLDCSGDEYIFGSECGSTSCSGHQRCDACVSDASESCGWSVSSNSCINMTSSPAFGDEVFDAESCPGSSGCDIQYSCSSCMNDQSNDCAWSPTMSSCVNITAGSGTYGDELSDVSLCDDTYGCGIYSDCYSCTTDASGDCGWQSSSYFCCNASRGECGGDEFFDSTMCMADDACTNAYTCESCTGQTAGDCGWSPSMMSCANVTSGTGGYGDEFFYASQCGDTYGCGTYLDCYSCTTDASGDCGWQSSSYFCCNASRDECGGGEFFDSTMCMADDACTNAYTCESCTGHTAGECGWSPSMMSCTNVTSGTGLYGDEFFYASQCGDTYGCGTYSDCYSCTTDASGDCGWQSSNYICCNSSRGECGGGEFFDSTMCMADDACTNAYTCESCTGHTAGECGWSPSMMSCANVTSGTGLYGDEFFYASQCGETYGCGTYSDCYSCTTDASGDCGWQSSNYICCNSSRGECVGDSMHDSTMCMSGDGCFSHYSCKECVADPSGDCGFSASMYSCGNVSAGNGVYGDEHQDVNRCDDSIGCAFHSDCYGCTSDPSMSCSWSPSALVCSANCTEGGCFGDEFHDSSMCTSGDGCFSHYACKECVSDPSGDCGFSASMYFCGNVSAGNGIYGDEHQDINQCDDSSSCSFHSDCYGCTSDPSMSCSWSPSVFVCSANCTESGCYGDEVHDSTMCMSGDGCFSHYSCKECVSDPSGDCGFSSSMYSCGNVSGGSGMYGDEHQDINQCEDSSSCSFHSDCYGCTSDPSMSCSWSPSALVCSANCTDGGCFGDEVHDSTMCMSGDGCFSHYSCMECVSDPSGDCGFSSSMYSCGNVSAGNGVYGDEHQDVNQCDDSSSCSFHSDCYGCTSDPSMLCSWSPSAFVCSANCTEGGCYGDEVHDSTMCTSGDGCFSHYSCKECVSDPSGDCGFSSSMYSCGNVSAGNGIYGDEHQDISQCDGSSSCSFHSDCYGCTSDPSMLCSWSPSAFVCSANCTDGGCYGDEFHDSTMCMGNDGCFSHYSCRECVSDPSGDCGFSSSMYSCGNVSAGNGVYGDEHQDINQCDGGFGCASHYDCYSCTSDPSMLCSWSPSALVCSANCTEGGCYGDEVHDSTMCMSGDGCFSHYSCRECVADPSGDCGFSASMYSCGNVSAANGVYGDEHQDVSQCDDSSSCSFYSDCYGCTTDPSMSCSWSPSAFVCSANCTDGGCFGDEVHDSSMCMSGDGCFSHYSCKGCISDPSGDCGFSASMYSCGNVSSGSGVYGDEHQDISQCGDSSNCNFHADCYGCTSDPSMLCSWSPSALVCSANCTEGGCYGDEIHDSSMCMSGDGCFSHYSCRECVSDVSGDCGFSASMYSCGNISAGNGVYGDEHQDINQCDGGFGCASHYDCYSCTSDPSMLCSWSPSALVCSANCTEGGCYGDEVHDSTMCMSGGGCFSHYSCNECVSDPSGDCGFSSSMYSCGNISSGNGVYGDEHQDINQCDGRFGCASHYDCYSCTSDPSMFCSWSPSAHMCSTNCTEGGCYGDEIHDSSMCMSGDGCFSHYSCRECVSDVSGDCGFSSSMYSCGNISSGNGVYGDEHQDINQCDGGLGCASHYDCYSCTSDPSMLCSWSPSVHMCSTNCTEGGCYGDEVHDSTMCMSGGGCVSHYSCKECVSDPSGDCGFSASMYSCGNISSGNGVYGDEHQDINQCDGGFGCASHYDCYSCTSDPSMFCSWSPSAHMCSTNCTEGGRYGDEIHDSTMCMSGDGCFSHYSCRECVSDVSGDCGFSSSMYSCGNISSGNGVYGDEHQDINQCDGGLGCASHYDCYSCTSDPSMLCSWSPSVHMCSTNCTEGGCYGDEVHDSTMCMSGGGCVSHYSCKECVSDPSGDCGFSASMYSCGNVSAGSGVYGDEHQDINQCDGGLGCASHYDCYSCTSDPSMLCSWSPSVHMCSTNCTEGGCYGDEVHDSTMCMSGGGCVSHYSCKECVSDPSGDCGFSASMYSCGNVSAGSGVYDDEHQDINQCDGGFGCASHYDCYSCTSDPSMLCSWSPSALVCSANCTEGGCYGDEVHDSTMCMSGGGCFSHYSCKECVSDPSGDCGFSSSMHSCGNVSSGNGVYGDEHRDISQCDGGFGCASHYDCYSCTSDPSMSCSWSPSAVVCSANCTEGGCYGDEIHDSTMCGTGDGCSYFHDCMSCTNSPLHDCGWSRDHHICCNVSSSTCFADSVSDSEQCVSTNCSDAFDCKSCSAHSGLCMWCEETQSCFHAQDNATVCESSVDFISSYCEDNGTSVDGCGEFLSCGTCLSSNQGCTWCHSSSTCADPSVDDFSCPLSGVAPELESCLVEPRWADVVPPSGVFHPSHSPLYDLVLVSELNITFVDLVLHESEILVCELAVGNGSHVQNLRVENESITGSNFQVVVPIEDDSNIELDSSGHYKPWVLRRCFIEDSTGFVVYSSDLGDFGFPARVFVHPAQLWMDAEVTRAIACQGSPGVYFDNIQPCTFEGDTLVALQYRNGNPVPLACWDTRSGSCDTGMCNAMVFPQCYSGDEYFHPYDEFSDLPASEVLRSGSNSFTGLRRILESGSVCPAEVDSSNGIGTLNVPVGSLDPVRMSYTMDVNGAHGHFKMRVQQSVDDATFTFTVLNLPAVANVTLSGASGDATVSVVSIAGEYNIAVNQLHQSFTGDLDFALDVMFDPSRADGDFEAEIETIVGIGVETNQACPTVFPVHFNTSAALHIYEDEGHGYCADGINNDMDVLDTFEQFGIRNGSSFAGSHDCYDPDCHGQLGPVQTMSDTGDTVYSTGVCNYVVELNCTDGYDNDMDSELGLDFTDCHDSDCFQNDDGCPSVELICDDGVNNDYDYTFGGNEYNSTDEKIGNNGAKFSHSRQDPLTDCEDVDCDDRQGGPSGQLCNYGHERNCSDGFNNDQMQLSDCELASVDSMTSLPTVTSAEYDCAEYCRANVRATESGDECFDMIDNDWDAVIVTGYYSSMTDYELNTTDGSGIDCRWGGYFGYGENFHPDEDCDGERTEFNGILVECQLKRELNCTDGADNDMDAYADSGMRPMPRPGWTASAYSAAFATAFSKGADLDDYDCQASPNAPQNESTEAAWCFDGIDNDLDAYFWNTTTHAWEVSVLGGIDCGDPDCAGVVNPANGDVCLSREYDANDPFYVDDDFPGRYCADGLDNDGDGFADCEDIHCFQMFDMCTSGPCYRTENISLASCADGLDNDFDGLLDCADPDCDSLFGAADGRVCQATETLCFDSFDNDGDGLTDCEDPDCYDRLANLLKYNDTSRCQLGFEHSCGDGFDNDGDGFVDCYDEDCDSMCGGVFHQGYYDQVMVPRTKFVSLNGVDPNEFYAQVHRITKVGLSWRIELHSTAFLALSQWTIGTAGGGPIKFQYFNASTARLEGPDAETFVLGVTSNGFVVSQTSPGGMYNVTLSVDAVAVGGMTFEITFADSQQNLVSLNNFVFARVAENIAPSILQVDTYPPDLLVKPGENLRLKAAAYDENAMSYCIWEIYSETDGLISTDISQLSCEYSASVMSSGNFTVVVTPVDKYGNVGEPFAENLTIVIQPDEYESDLQMYNRESNTFSHGNETRLFVLGVHEVISEISFVTDSYTDVESCGILVLDANLTLYEVGSFDPSFSTADHGLTVATCMLNSSLTDLDSVLSELEGRLAVVFVEAIAHEGSVRERSLAAIVTPCRPTSEVGLCAYADYDGNDVVDQCEVVPTPSTTVSTTASPSASTTGSESVSPSVSASVTTTTSGSPSGSVSSTATVSSTVSSTATLTSTATVSVTTSSTVSVTATLTATATASLTEGADPSQTPTTSRTPTTTPTISNSASPTPFAPAPVVRSAVFSSDGFSVTVEFDVATNRALMFGAFATSCSRMYSSSFITKLGSGPSCVWISDTQNTISFGSGATLRPGDMVQLRAASIRRKTQRSLTSDNMVEISIPDNLVPPSAVLSIPLTVSECGDIRASGAFSTGRSLTYAWRVVGGEEGVLTARGRSITVTPTDLSEHSITSPYTVTLTVTDFFNLEHSVNATVTRQLDSKFTATITGPKTRSTNRLKGITLTSALSIDSCGDDELSIEQLSYLWEVTSGPSDPTFTSTSIPIDFSRSTLTIPKDALIASSQYVFKLSVSAVLKSVSGSSSQSTSTATVNVTVGSQALVAVISGGDREVSVSDTLSLSGLSSRDPDASSIPFSYLWTCACSNCENAGEFCTSLEATTAVLQVTNGSLLAGRTYVMTLTVSKGQRSAVATSSLVVFSDFRLPVSINPLSQLKHNPSENLQLTAALTLTVAEMQDILNCAETTVKYLWSTPNTDTLGILSRIATQTGVNRRFLGVPASAIPDGANTFQFSVTAQFCNKTGVASISVPMNTPPFGGEVSVEVSNTSLIPQVSVSATGWNDADAPLTYSYFYQRGNSLPFEVLTLKNEPEITGFPSPSENEDSSIVVSVRITDSLGAVTRVRQRIILENKISTGSGGGDNAQDIIDATSNVLEQFESEQDTDSLMQVIGVTASLLNEFSATDALVNNEEEEEEEEEDPCAIENNPACPTFSGGCLQTSSYCEFGTCNEATLLCVCDDGYTGLKCNISLVDLCREDGCHVTNGVCQSDGSCKCRAGYTGDLCELSLLEECLLDAVCENNGTCLETGKCDCEEGYFGATCGLTRENLQERQNFRRQLVQTLELVADTAPQTVDSISKQFQVLQVVTAAAEEIDNATTSRVLSLTNSLISGLSNIADGEGSTDTKDRVGRDALAALNNVYAIADQIRATVGTGATISIVVNTHGHREVVVLTTDQEKASEVVDIAVQNEQDIGRVMSVVMSSRIPGELFSYSSTAFSVTTERQDTDTITSGTFRAPQLAAELSDAERTSFTFGQSILNVLDDGDDADIDVQVISYEEDPFDTGTGTGRPSGVNDSSLASVVSSVTMRQNGSEVGVEGVDDGVVMDFIVQRGSCEDSLSTVECSYFSENATRHCDTFNCPDNSHCIEISIAQPPLVQTVEPICLCSAGFVPYFNASDPSAGNVTLLTESGLAAGNALVCIAGCQFSPEGATEPVDMCGENGVCNANTGSCDCDPEYYGYDCRFRASCEFYNITVERWEDTGCVNDGVFEDDGNVFVRCICDHATSFGSFRFPVVKFPDFSKLLKFTTESAIFAAVLFVLYIAYLIIAYDGFRRDERKFRHVVPFLMYKLYVVRKRLAETAATEAERKKYSKKALRSVPRELVDHVKDDHMLISYFYKAPTDTYTRPQRATVIFCIIVATLGTDALLSGSQQQFVTDYILIGLLAGAFVFPFVYVCRFLFAHSKPMRSLDPYPTTSSPAKAKLHWALRKAASESGSPTVSDRGKSTKVRPLDNEIELEPVVSMSGRSRPGDDDLLTQDSVQIETRSPLEAPSYPPPGDTKESESKRGEKEGDDDDGYSQANSDMDSSSTAALEPPGPSAPQSPGGRPLSSVVVEQDTADVAGSSTAKKPKIRALRPRTMLWVLAGMLALYALLWVLIVEVGGAKWFWMVFIFLGFIFTYVTILKVAVLGPRKKLGKDKRFLPPKTLYFAYTFACSYQLFAIICLIAYANDFDGNNRKNWLIGSAMGIGQDFFIIEPLFILIGIFAHRFLTTKCERCWGKIQLYIEEFRA